MQVKEEFYGDGMPQIHFAGGLVRMDFATFQPDPAGKEPTSEKHDEEAGGTDGRDRSPEAESDRESGRLKNGGHDTSRMRFDAASDVGADRF